MKRVFVDTNVLIDFICNREEFYDNAETLFSLALSGKIIICFSDVSVVNTLYVGKKYGFSIDELSEQLLNTLAYCDIATANNDVTKKALESDWRDKEDALQYFSALECGANTIVTRNVKDFNNSIIQVVNPADITQV